MRRKLKSMASAMLLLLLFSSITSTVKACVLAEVKIVEVEKFKIEKRELDHHDSAYAMVSPPGGPKMEDGPYIDGLPSRAEVKAPENPDHSRNASAKAYGHGCQNKWWTGWIVDSQSGWTADAKASATRNVKVTSLEVTIITVTWAEYWWPFHDSFCVIFYDSLALGIITYNVQIRSLSPYETLFNSTTVFTGADSPIVWDNTGRLYWEKFTYERDDGKIYSNAYRPANIEILLREYEMELDPLESVDMDFKIELSSSLRSPSGFGVIGQEMASTPREGGFLVPVDKFGLLAPYVGVALSMLIATFATTFIVKHHKRKNDEK